MMWGTYSCGTWKSMSCGRHGVSAQGPPKVGKRFTCTVQSMSTSFLIVPLSSYSFACDVRNCPPHCLGSALAWWGRRQEQETPGLGRSPLRRIIMIMIGWGWRWRGGCWGADDDVGEDGCVEEEKLPARMNVRRPIMPNWSTTMFAGMFVTRPDQDRVRFE